MEKLFIIDASGYIYRSYFAIRNMTNPKGESTNALFGFIRSILKLCKDFHPEHLVCVFDGPNNAKSRILLYPAYKAHREKMPPDLLYQIAWAQEFCELMNIPFLKVPEVEADDTMGSVALWAAQEAQEVYLCTSDKDMAQLVTDKIKILNTFKENLVLGPKEIDAAYGVPPHQILDWLSMTGDSSDNIPGVPGFGPKTASLLLKEHGSLNYILEHPEVVSGKKRETLISHMGDARISQQLVALNTSVEFPKEQDFFKLKQPDHIKLKEFYAYMNFHTLTKELEQNNLASDKRHDHVEPLPVAYRLVDDEKSLHDLLALLSQQKEVCFDTETTDVSPLKAELVGIGLGYKSGEAWYVPANGQLGLDYVLKMIKPFFENPKIGFYGHNVKYDYHVLRNYNIKLATISFDTILASYILNSHIRQHNLDYLALELFNKVKIPISDLIGKGKTAITMREVSIDQVRVYCCEDVDYTCRLKERLEPLLEERKLMPLLKTLELPLLMVLAQMERRGIYLEPPVLNTTGEKVLEHIKRLEEEIYALAGEEFNLNSPKQLSDILFNKLQIKPPKKTATGHSTNADVLEFLKNDYPIAGKLIEYRTHEKLRSTYIDTLPTMINAKTNRIHCTFNQFVAATGRLSSQDPNLQNIPTRSEIGKEIRQAFRPERDGWSYLAADYSQIELRLLAHLSEDPTLLSAFENNEDIHAHTASVIFNVPLTEVTKELRYSAKAVNFGVIYGQQAYGLSQELGIDFKVAASFIEMYFTKYYRVKEYLESCKEKARKAGKAVTIIGRERAIPEINSANVQIRHAAERLATNTPLQGTAADLIKMAMLKIDSLLKKEGKLGYMILQIHDELIFEIPDFEIVSFEPLVRDAMQNVLKLKVPLIVDISIGKNWKEC